MIVHELVAEYGLAALALAGTALSALLSRFVWVQIGNATIRGILERVAREAALVVAEVWQTYVAALKAKRADGQLTGDEAKEAFRLAMEKLKARLGWKLLARIPVLFGFDAAAVDGWLGTWIEASVDDAKKRGHAVGQKTAGALVKAATKAVPPVPLR